jgi:serine/threonine protein kinase
VTTEELGEGAVIDGKYELVEVLGKSEYAEAWLARHLLGRFECVLKVYDEADAGYGVAAREFSLLSRLFHPSIVRVFDMGKVAATDTYYASVAYIHGDSLRSVLEGGRAQDARRTLGWFRDLLGALQYMHRLGITHRNICPESIVVSDGPPVLIDFSMLPEQNRRTGPISYKDPEVLEAGWSPSADLYGLALTFLEVWMGRYPMKGGFTDVTEDDLRAVETKGMPRSLLETSLRLLRHEQTISPDEDYLRAFGLEGERRRVDAIDADFAKKWGISKGYMTFLILDMLNDRRPRARTQWVLNALRSRSIPGNRTNRGSMNATVSRLKSAGIAEDHGRKIRLTEEFLEDWGRQTRPDSR